MPSLFISHSSQDDLAAEAIRTHLVKRGWSREDIFLDFSVEGIGAHEKWKASLAHANSSANALLCLVSPDWLASMESQVERRVAETLRELDPRRNRAILVAILRDVTVAQLLAQGFGEDQIVDLSALGVSVLIRAELPGRNGRPGRIDDIRLNNQALEKIERALRLTGVAPESFDWTARDPARPSPYPGLEAFTENDAAVFFGREGRLAQALEIIDNLRRGNGSRVLSIIAASGVGKSSFLKAGLWPRLARQSGVAPLVVVRPGPGILFGRDGGFVYALSEWFRRAGRVIDPGDIRGWFAGRPIREGLVAALHEVVRITGKGRTLILAIDQAEELFDTIDDSRADEGRQFLLALFTLLTQPSGNIDLLLVLTIRADSYDSLASTLANSAEETERTAIRRSALDETSITLAPLAPAAYRDVIRRPAQVALNTTREVFEPSLVDHLLETFTGANALPLLAMTLEQLFTEYGSRRAITRADYAALYGSHTGAEGAVTRALTLAYRLAQSAGTDETLKRLLIPGLATWDPQAGEGGVAKRRIAQSTKLRTDNPDLKRLADALASPAVRLLIKGRNDFGPTLEVAHEALLRVQPVKQWIDEYASQLTLRDQVEQEASEWWIAQQTLVSARTPGSKKYDLENRRDVGQKTVEAALAARRGPRLEAAIAMVADPVFAGQISDQARQYIDACNARETEDRNRQRRIIGNAYVQPALQALENGLVERALRVAATGALLANDLHFQIVPELLSPLARAISSLRTRAILKGHGGPVTTASFSRSGELITTDSFDGTIRQWVVQTGKEHLCLNDPISSSDAGVVRGWTADDVEDFVRWGAHSSETKDGQRIITTTSGPFGNVLRVWTTSTGVELLSIKGVGFTNPSFSPDGTKILAHNVVDATIWDSVTGKEINSIYPGNELRLALFSPDGKYVLTITSGTSATLWDAENEKEIVVLTGHNRALVSATFNANGDKIATASEDDTARIWDAVTGAELFVLRGHNSTVSSVAFSSDSQLVVTGSWDRTARVWSARNGEQLSILKGHNASVNSAAFSPNGQLIVTASNDHSIRLWDTSSGEQIMTFSEHARVKAFNDFGVWSCGFSPDGRHIVTAPFDGAPRILTSERGRDAVAFIGHSATLCDAEFSKDGRHVLTASEDGTARLWDTATGTEVTRWSIAGRSSSESSRLRPSVRFNADGKLIVLTDGRDIQVLCTKNGKVLSTIGGLDATIDSVEFSPDGKLILGVSNATASIWATNSGQLVRQFETHPAELMKHKYGGRGRGFFSPDGALIAASSPFDFSVKVWSMESGRQLAAVKDGNGHGAAAFSRDGRQFVVGDHMVARLFDVPSMTEVAVLKGHERIVVGVVASPDALHVLTESWDETARIWQLESGEMKRALSGADFSITRALFSQDGQRIITSAKDEIARIWDLDSGAEIDRLHGHCPVISASFSPDGHWALTSFADHTMKLWDISRSAHIIRDRAVALTASLSNGVGCLTEHEKQELLLQDAPADGNLYEEALRQLGKRPDDSEIAAMSAALNAPLHPNCYLSPTDFARFGSGRELNRKS